MSLRHAYQVDEQIDVGRQQDDAAEKAPFLAHGAEDEVGFLFRDEVGFGDGAVEESFSEQASRADGNLGLVDVVAYALGVFHLAEEDVDAVALVGFEYVFEGEVDRKGEEAAYHKEGCRVPIGARGALGEPHEEIEQA